MKELLKAYYFDLPFEETLKRHQTKPNCNSFGEAEMREWWCYRDFVPVLQEKIITKEMGIVDIIKMIKEQMQK